MFTPKKLSERSLGIYLGNLEYQDSKERELKKRANELRERLIYEQRNLTQEDINKILRGE